MAHIRLKDFICYLDPSMRGILQETKLKTKEKEKVIECKKGLF